MPNLDTKTGYFQIKDSVFEQPEYGVHFSDENVVFFVKQFFKDLRSFNMMKARAFAQITSVKYKLVYDSTVDLINDEDGWVEIKNEDDVDIIDFVPETYYVERDENSVEEMKEELRKSVEANKAKRQSKKDAKKSKTDKS